MAALYQHILQVINGQMRRNTMVCSLDFLCYDIVLLSICYVLPGTTDQHLLAANHVFSRRRGLHVLANCFRFLLCRV
jgi:hypothetical protein